MLTKKGPLETGIPMGFDQKTNRNHDSLGQGLLKASVSNGERGFCKVCAGTGGRGERFDWE